MKLRKLILPVIAGAAVYYAVFGGEYSVFQVHRMEQEKTHAAAQLKQVKQENARLKAHADSLAHDPAALERIARERYGMIKKNEKLYRFADTTAADSGAARDSSQ